MRMPRWFRRSVEEVAADFSIPTQRSRAAEQHRQETIARIKELGAERKALREQAEATKQRIVDEMTPEQRRDLEERAYGLQLAMAAFDIRSSYKLTPKGVRILELGRVAGIDARAVPADFDVEKAKAEADLDLFKLGPEGLPTPEAPTPGTDYSGRRGGGYRPGRSDTGITTTLTSFGGTGGFSGL